MLAEYSLDNGATWIAPGSSAAIPNNEIPSAGASAVIRFDATTAKVWRFRNPSYYQIGLSELRVGCGVPRFLFRPTSNLVCYGHLCDIDVTRQEASSFVHLQGTFDAARAQVHTSGAIWQNTAIQTSSRGYQWDDSSAPGRPKLPAKQTCMQRQAGAGGTYGGVGSSSCLVYG